MGITSPATDAKRPEGQAGWYVAWMLLDIARCLPNRGCRRSHVLPAEIGALFSRFTLVKAKSEEENDAEAESEKLKKNSTARQGGCQSGGAIDV